MKFPRHFQLKPRKTFFFFFGLFRNCLNWDSLRWSHIHFICIPPVHIISFCVSFLSRVDELNELASLQCMGRERRGHGFESRSSPEKPFFRAISQLLILRFTAMVTYFFHFQLILRIWLGKPYFASLFKILRFCGNFKIRGHLIFASSSN